MKNIAILVPAGEAVLGSIEGPHKIFNTVNEFLAGMGQEPMFVVKTVGIDAEPRVYEGLFTVQPDLTMENAGPQDLIIIPAPKGDMTTAVEANKAFIPWLVAQHTAGAELASLCYGVFLLASTGLLKGKKCSTHWIAEREFREMFPDVNLVPSKIITDEFGVYSSGGAYSFLNLILYLVEKFAGREIAILCSKVFEVEFDRSNQSQFMIFKGQRAHTDEPVKKAQQFIEDNFRGKITVDQLASEVLLSRRSLERRFKKATSNTVVEYIQGVKVEAAKMRLESSRDNVNEVMYNVGYSDTKAFRTAFKRITGISPAQYKNKYNRQADTYSGMAKLARQMQEN